MMKKIIVFIFIFISTFSVVKNKVFAVDCLAITQASSDSDKNIQKIQEAQKKNTGTLTGDVNYLNSQINALKTKIKGRSLAIAQLKVSIKEKSNKIEDLSDKIENQYESLAQLIKNTNDLDNGNLVHLLLSNDNISDFYSYVESYSSLKESIKISVD